MIFNGINEHFMKFLSLRVLDAVYNISRSWRWRQWRRRSETFLVQIFRGVTIWPILILVKIYWKRAFAFQSFFVKKKTNLECVKCISFQYPTKFQKINISFISTTILGQVLTLLLNFNDFNENIQIHLKTHNF